MYLLHFVEYSRKTNNTLKTTGISIKMNYPNCELHDEVWRASQVERDRRKEGRASGELFSFISAQMLHCLWEVWKGKESTKW